MHVCMCVGMHGSMCVCKSVNVYIWLWLLINTEYLLWWLSTLYIEALGLSHEPELAYWAGLTSQHTQGIPSPLIPH